MPEFFQEWLRKLPNEQAAAMREYFDANFTHTEDVVDVIASSHPVVVADLCGDPNPVGNKF